MSRPLTIHVAAEVQIIEAADYYDLSSPGLGREFIEEVWRAIGNTTEFPEAGPLVRGRVRKRRIARFPYSLVYSVRPDEIRILAVAHQRKRPYYWRHRH